MNSYTFVWQLKLFKKENFLAGEMMTLSILGPNQVGTIEKINWDNGPEVIKRLKDLGIAEGREIVCIMQCPFKGPTVFQVGDSILSLETEVASTIMVRVK
jgi:Fe2+ transport system protein FeoA